MKRIFALSPPPALIHTLIRQASSGFDSRDPLPESVPIPKSVPIN